MSYDIFVEYKCETDDDVRKIVGNHKEAYTELKDIYTRIFLLSPSRIAACREYAKSGHFKYGGGYKSLVYDRKKPNTYTQQLIEPRLKELEELNLYPPNVDINKLPYLSFFIQIHFTMATPCLIGESEHFYVHESSQQKEHTFKIPLIPGTSWKGTCRDTAVRVAAEKGQNTAIVDRLFGSARDDYVEEREGTGFQARLHFYTSLFDRIGLDVINPHSRITKAGTVPILEELVIPTAQGVFSLLYVPSDLYFSADTDKLKAEVKEDLIFISDLLPNVFHVYGFSAKKTRGYGLAESRFTKKVNGRNVSGGFFEVSGVPIYQEEEPSQTESKPKSQSSGGGQEDWRAKLERLARKVDKGGEEVEKEDEKDQNRKDNKFSYFNQFKRLVNKVVEQLS